MATATTTTKTVVTLELTEKEALFLHDLMYRHVAGAFFYDNHYDSISKAIEYAGYFSSRIDGVDHSVVTYNLPNAKVDKKEGHYDY